jgi:hypothetical protein
MASLVIGLMGRGASQSDAPHHEGLGSRREESRHPEEPAEGGRLEGWLRED